MPTGASTDSAAVHCFGTKLSVVSAEYTSGTLSAIAQGALEVAEVTQISGPKVEAPQTKVTHLRSKNKRNEYVSAFADPGKAEFTINYTKAMFAALRSYLPSVADVKGGRRVWVLEFPDGPANGIGSRLYFVGSLLALGPEIPEDDRITCTATIQATGDSEFVPSAGS